MISMIGIDEVGRGAWAGPLLVVAARQIEELPLELTDSKLLSANKRSAMMEALKNSCLFGEGWVSAKEIDTQGLAEAMRLAVSRALTALNVLPGEDIIMDGSINYCDQRFQNVQCVIKADSLHPVVSAASVYAKVRRDAYMTQLDTASEGKYQFSRHVGYGTALHKQTLLSYGVSDIHRRSFKPIRDML